MSDPEVIEETPTIRELREQIKDRDQRLTAANEFQTRAEAAERQLAFAKAGIDLADPKNKYFVNGYDGEVDPETIKAQAIADGFLKAPEAAPEDDLSAFQRANEASVAQGPSPSTMAAYEAEVRAAGSAAELDAIQAKYGRGMPTQ